MVLLVIFVVVTVILLCCVYSVVASLLFHVWLYACVYVPTCVLYRSGKEERHWPISGAKINNQSSIINHLLTSVCKHVNDLSVHYSYVHDTTPKLLASQL